MSDRQPGEPPSLFNRLYGKERPGAVRRRDGEKKMRILFTGFLLLLALTACAGAVNETAPQEPAETPPEESTAPGETPAAPAEQETAVPSATPEKATPDRGARLETPPPTKVIESVPTSDPPQPVTGEVPPALLDDIFADLEERSGGDRAQFEVLRAEQAIWPDGSLGCPKPGEMYTQAIVEGYWVEISYGGQTFDYRVSDSGYFFLCESPLPGSLGAPTG